MNFGQSANPHLYETLPPPSLLFTNFAEFVFFFLPRPQLVDYADTLLWSIIEIYLNVLVPNLLGIYSLLASRFPNFFGHDGDKERERQQQNSFFRNRVLGGGKKKEGGVETDMTVSVGCEEGLEVAA